MRDPGDWHMSCAIDWTERPCWRLRIWRRDPSAVDALFNVLRLDRWTVERASEHAIALRLPVGQVPPWEEDAAPWEQIVLHLGELIETEQ